MIGFGRDITQQPHPLVRSIPFPHFVTKQLFVVYTRNALSRVRAQLSTEIAPNLASSTRNSRHHSSTRHTRMFVDHIIEIRRCDHYSSKSYHMLTEMMRQGYDVRREEMSFISHRQELLPPSS